MPTRSVEELVELHRLESPDAIRTAWRHGMAMLARAVADQTPAPLEGLPPDALLASIRIAIEQRLLDDLDWLSPSAAAVAIYELAAALPIGPERRSLGRRAFAQLYEGDAATFVALATSLAAGSRRALTGAPERARVALALDLPSVRADPLALALVSRRDLARDWLSRPSTGALPSRRLAARLLERAAREAALRAARGDEGVLRVFQLDAVRSAWRRLLLDRESLVWRHVAAARGLLAAAVPALAEEIERDLDPKLSPTEWRRAAASLGASVAVRPDAAVDRIRALIGSAIFKRDTGVAGATILGLPRAAETEPAAAEEILESLVRVGGLYAVESLVDLFEERVSETFGDVAREIARAHLRALSSVGSKDDGERALVRALDEELTPSTGRAGQSLRSRLAGARATFADKGPREANRRAREVLGAAQALLASLERTKEEDAEGRMRSFAALRELEMGLLETSALHDLLLCGGRDVSFEAAVEPLDEIHARLTHLLLEREREEPWTGGEVAHPTLRLRRLRTLLHLLDSESFASESPARGAAARERRLEATQYLLDHASREAASPLRRTVCAALARACDALVRDEVWELSDLFIASLDQVRAVEDLVTLAEASMEPDIEAILEAYATLLRRASPAPVASTAPGRSRQVTVPTIALRVQALAALAHSMAAGRSPRTDALRGALLRFARALEAVEDAHSLPSLLAAEDALGLLESSAESLARLVAGARRRLGSTMVGDAPRAGSAIRWLVLAAERTVRGSDEGMSETIGATVRILRQELPEPIADVAETVLRRLEKLPVEAEEPIPLVKAARMPLAEPPLPPWLPPSRTLGGFYVVRPLGNGAVGTVFVARRSEERHDADAERFALKVPSYDGDAARLLSEDQFDELFRGEAGALLALPPHGNLARFVTFDAGARPKPILVMELVEGPTLERVVESADLDVPRAMQILDGIAAGLEVMHRSGVGHLDVKPSNVILRDPDGAGPASGKPVLVDFGLAGKHLRPGCATAPYGAPEIWGLVPEDFVPSPLPADMYSFGCLAYELLTGRRLFDAPNEMGLVSLHISHDGAPPGIPELARDPKLRPLAQVLSATLRRDPRARASIGAVRKGLAEIAKGIASRSWPLQS